MEICECIIFDYICMMTKKIFFVRAGFKMVEMIKVMEDVHYLGYGFMIVNHHGENGKKNF